MKGNIKNMKLINFLTVIALGINDKTINFNNMDIQYIIALLMKLFFYVFFRLFKQL